MYQMIGFLFSIFYSYLILPKKEKKKPAISITCYPILYQGMIIIPYSKKKAIHIHHWVFYLILLLLKKYIYQTVWGFSLGLCLQGLTYQDRFRIIEDNPY